MKKNTLVIISIVIVIMIFIGVYFFIYENKSSEPTSQVTSNNTDNIVIKKEVSSPQDLALTLEELPTGWEITTRGERVKSDVSDYGLNLGWKSGYNIVFRKTDSKDIQITESISLYPKENMSFILEDSKIGLKTFSEGINGTKINYRLDDFDRKYRYDALSNIEIGDESIVYKLVYLESIEVMYVLEFVKDDYYIYLDGYDYELLKELAKKVEAKFL